MEKYKDIFKNWVFWLIVIILSIFQMINFIGDYGNIFLAEILGIVVGSFIFMLIMFSMVFFVGKIFGWGKKK